MNNLGLTGRLSAWSAHHPWLVIAGWIVALAAISGVSATTGSRLTTDISFTSKPDSQVARELLEDARGGAEPFWEQVIVQSGTLTVDDPAFEAFVHEVTGAIRATNGAVDPHNVFNVYEIEAMGPDSPLADMAPGLVSQDRTTTIIPSLLIGDLDQATKNVVLLEDALHELTGRDGFTVVTGGFASVNHAFTEAAEADLAAEFKALPFAFLILIAVFGAIMAAVLPMVLAFLAIGIAFGLIAVISLAFEMSFFVSNVTLMIGLAVGIDYALFVMARYREERRHGREKFEAIAIAGDTGARAVVFSGFTVVIALFGMFVVPTSIFQSFAIGASTVVLITIVQSVTLLPAVVALMGDRINWLSIPFIGGNTARDEERGFWAGAARFVMAYPWPMAIGTAALLVLMTVPYFSINLGASGTASLPAHFDARQAFDILDEKFSAGLIQPTDIVIQAEDVNAPAVQEAIGRMQAALAQDERYNLVGFEQLNGGLAVLQVAVPGESASSEAQPKTKNKQQTKKKKK